MDQKLLCLRPNGHYEHFQKGHSGSVSICFGSLKHLVDVLTYWWQKYIEKSWDSMMTLRIRVVRGQVRIEACHMNHFGHVGGVVLSVWLITWDLVF